jgi:hypothetical protein
MSNATTYTGGCHCGKVRYEVTTGLERVIACNCSICSKKAHLLTFVPATQFRLLSGEDALTDYQFNRKHIHHLFCSVCGIQSFSRGTNAEGQPTVSVNARCLDGVDPASLPITNYDGKSH